MTEDVLDERCRAEDILLGGLGFGEDARIVSLKVREDGLFEGTGQFSDGETFTFEADDCPGELERWAIGILLKQGDFSKVA